MIRSFGRSAGRSSYERKICEWTWKLIFQADSRSTKSPESKRIRSCERASERQKLGSLLLFLLSHFLPLYVCLRLCAKRLPLWRLIQFASKLFFNFFFSVIKLISDIYTRVDRFLVFKMAGGQVSFFHSPSIQQRLELVIVLFLPPTFPCSSCLQLSSAQL